MRRRGGTLDIELGRQKLLLVVPPCHMLLEQRNSEEIRQIPVEMK